MTIKIYCPDRLAEVVSFALDNHCLDKLTSQLEYLSTYAAHDGPENVCHLHADYAENSFEFLIERPDGTRWFNGGLIYSGPGQPLDGSGPAFTVSLDMLNGRTDVKHNWSVHT